MAITPTITYNGNQRTISYNLSDAQQAARAEAEAKALAAGASAVEADSAGNAAGNLAGEAGFIEIGRQLGQNSASDDNPNAGTPNSVAPEPQEINVGVQSVNAQAAGTKTSPMTLPGARKGNPLVNFSSSTYCLSLYMVTPEYYNQMVDNNPPGTLPRTSNQVYLVAQSAGINNTYDNRLLTLTGQLGRGQPGLDYYIEDLSLMTIFPGGPTRATVASSIKFKIVEPIGFTFMQKLKVASDAICKLSPQLRSAGQFQPIHQTFILGIRFYGYDASGNIVMPQGTGLNTDSNSIAERFIPIKMTTLKFKVDEKATIYSCEANQLPEQVSFGTDFVIKTKTELNGSTIGEVLGASGTTSTSAVSLVQYVNQFNQSQKEQNNISRPNTFTIEFIGEAKTLIGNAKLIDDEDFSSILTQTSNDKKTSDSTVKSSFTTTTFNPNNRSVSIAAGTPIAQVIDNIITKSSFVSDATKQVFSSAAETKSLRNSGSKPLKWYSINPVTRIVGRDPKTQDWVYGVTYQISIYEVPYVRNKYNSSTTPFPGAYKIYNYMFTGLNSEVLEYEQTYDSLYYIPLSASAGVNGNTNNSSPGIPSKVETGVNSDPTMGKVNRGSEINDNIRASLYSPGDNAIAKMKIIGDPDLISTIVGMNQASAQAAQDGAKKWYGTDFTINPIAGQAFIQIIFNVAEDYLPNGLMDVSDKIQFYNSNEIQRSGIKGVVYKLFQVESSFSKGMFTQQIEAVICTPDTLLGTRAGNTSANSQRENSSTSATGDGTTRTSDTRTGGGAADAGYDEFGEALTTNTTSPASTGTSITKPTVSTESTNSSSIFNNSTDGRKQLQPTQAYALDDKSVTQNTTSTIYAAPTAEEQAASDKIWNSPSVVQTGFVTPNGAVIGASSKTSRIPPGSY